MHCARLNYAQTDKSFNFVLRSDSSVKSNQGNNCSYVFEWNF